MDYLLDPLNLVPEAFKEQEGRPYIRDLNGHPTSYRMLEGLAKVFQFKVLVHTLSFHQIAAFILASRRSPRPQIFFWFKWFLLTLGSTPDGP